MTFLYNALVVLHFIGLASVVGGFLVQVRSAEKGVNPAMLHGALTQLVTGLLMVGIIEMGMVDETLDMAKISVKLVITLVITVLAFVGRKKPLPQTGLWGAIGGLAIVNIVLAVFWS